LFEHSWPGNVRELQHAVERAILLCKGETIDVAALPFGQKVARALAATTVASAGTVTRTVEASSTEQIKVSPHENGGDPQEQSFDSIGRIIVDKVPEPKSGA
jgi:DNA-binding NtrC family response regulator